MHVYADPKVCGAHGDCLLAAPDVFDLPEDDDVVAVLQPDIDDRTLIAQVRDAASRCPTHALRLTQHPD